MILSERDDPQLGKVVRWVSRVIGVLLGVWALSDDPVIGGGMGFGYTQAAVLGVGILLVASSFAPLGWNARGLALVLSTGFVLVIGEVGLRALYSARYQRPFQFDEQILYRLVPDSLREYRREPVNGGDRILYRVNSQGFRGEPLMTDGRPRVVVYGDSFIQGEFSALEKSFTERLEFHLAERLGSEVEVVNAGVAGYGPGQALGKMRGELEALDPDLVIMAVFAGNDFGDMVRNKLYRVSAAGELIANASTIMPEVRRSLDARTQELLLKRVLRDAVHGLAIRFGVRDAKTSDVAEMSPTERLEHFRKQHIAEFDEFVLNKDDVVRELAWDTYDADVSLTPRSESARYKVRLMDAILGQMQSLTSDLSVPIVLIPIPHPIDVGGHDTGKVDLVQYPDYKPRGLVGILEGIGRRRGIPTVDLFEVFDEMGTERTYFQGFDDHWNDDGQDVAGEVVADFITKGEFMRPLSGGTRQAKRSH